MKHRPKLNVQPARTELLAPRTVSLRIVSHLARRSGRKIARRISAKPGLQQLQAFQTFLPKLVLIPMEELRLCLILILELLVVEAELPRMVVVVVVIVVVGRGEGERERGLRLRGREYGGRVWVGGPSRGQRGRGGRKAERVGGVGGRLRRVAVVAHEVVDAVVRGEGRVVGVVVEVVGCVHTHADVQRVSTRAGVVEVVIRVRVHVVAHHVDIPRLRTGARVVEIGDLRI